MSSSDKYYGERNEGRGCEVMVSWYYSIKSAFRCDDI